MTVTLLAATDSDASLMARAQAGERAAAELLWERYYPKVCRFMRSRLWGSGDAAEDLASDVMERTLLHPSRWIDTGGPFSSWLYAVARNRLFDHFHEGRKRPPLRSLNALLETAWQGPQDGTAVRAFRVVLERDSLNQLLTGAHLTAAQRTVVMMRVLCDVSIAETARRTGLTEQAVRQQQARAFNRLRRFSARSTTTDEPTTKMTFGRGRTRPPQ